jgi:hypothetical protein
MIAPTAQRVEAQTKPEILEHIHREIERHITYFRHHPGEIQDRLAELDREWNIERMLETQLGSMALLGTIMSLITRNKWWLILTGVPASFMLMHAIQGWCPPLPLLRSLGVRTAREIEEERCALKTMLEQD